MNGIQALIIAIGIIGGCILGGLVLWAATGNATVGLFGVAGLYCLFLLVNRDV